MRYPRLAPSIIAVLLCAANGCANLRVVDDDPLPLAHYAALSGLHVGAAVNEVGFQDRYAPYNQKYMEVMGREFTALTPEGSLKMANCWKAPDFIDFGKFQLEADFAREHGQKIRAHTLLWFRSVPDWLRAGYTSGEYTGEEIASMVEGYINEVMGWVEEHYPGMVICWDVVNEAIGPEQLLSQNGSYGWRPASEDFWTLTLGPDYVERAFAWARAAAPNAKLFYNDYKIEYENPKAKAAIALIDGLLDKGVPIDGVGFQCHFSLELSELDYEWVDFSLSSISSYIDLYAALGLEVHVTELDFAINRDGKGLSQAKLDRQAVFYGDFAAMALSKDAVKAICLWGCTDKLSWLNEPGSPEWPLLYDTEVEKKKAYIEFKRAFREHTGL